ncbi:putative phage abortive infection protein [Oceanobacillus chungangensis]|uniref:Phage abortive infection protein n=1 Tax=Oceanobacillus chungangensis TaxID=1229152 RepID=A0A3D8PL36_9BACI|nr:putative phage abortive infection protein [Oceanobacillus chungangensis]RDW15941.1 hypothetical protein CWR45_15715 [Oceanobacillus chungangensis]
MKEKVNLQNTFMILGSILLIAAFVIPFLIEQKFAVYLGEAATPFLSAAAFLLLVSANIMQQKELALQREELKATRNVFMEQSKTMTLQRFENIFFQMILLNLEVVNSIEIGKDTKGKTALQRLSIRLSQSMENIHEKKEVIETYNTFLDKYYDFFGHYFMNLYRIIKLIDLADLTEEEKRNYIGVLRAQLSRSELILIFYNSLGSQGAKFKKLIIKYNFFEDHLKAHHLANEKHFKLLTL